LGHNNAAGTRLPSRCLATKCGTNLSQHLLSNIRRATRTETQINARDFCRTLLRWAQESATHIISFIKIVSGIQRLKGGLQAHKYIGVQTHREHGDCINFLSFFEHEESRLNIFLIFFFFKRITFFIFIYGLKLLLCEERILIDRRTDTLNYVWVLSSSLITNSDL
jgi:hypothetical protein